MKGRTVLILVFLSFFLFSGTCEIYKKVTAINPLSMPDKILVYKKGIEIDISKTDSEYKEILKFSNARFPKYMCRTTDVINNEVIEKYKKETVAVELIYNKEQSMELKNDKQGSFKYNKLFFVFEDNHQYLSSTFQYGDKEEYKDSSIGQLLEVEELTNIIKEITGKIH